MKFLLVVILTRGVSKGTFRKNPIYLAGKLLMDDSKKITLASTYNLDKNSILKSVKLVLDSPIWRL